MKKIKDSITVIGEGITEYYYFNSLKDDFRQLNIKPAYPKHSSGLDYLEQEIDKSIDAGYSFNVHHVAKEIPVGHPDMITYKDYDGSYKTSGLFIEPQIGRNFSNSLSGPDTLTLQEKVYLYNSSNKKLENIK